MAIYTLERLAPWSICVFETILVRPDVVSILCTIESYTQYHPRNCRLGLQLGKRAYKAYGEKLATTMDKILLVSEVATLSRKRSLERSLGMYEGESSLNLNISFDSEESSKNPSQSPTPSAGQKPSIHGSMLYDSTENSNKQLILQMLEEWEEPVLAKNDKVSFQCGLNARVVPKYFLTLCLHRPMRLLLPFFSFDKV